MASQFFRCKSFTIYLRQTEDSCPIQFKTYDDLEWFSLQAYPYAKYSEVWNSICNLICSSNNGWRDTLSISPPF